MGERLFIYGTLLPGHEPPAVHDVCRLMRPVGAGVISGCLYDLGAYPGAVLDESSGSVSGEVVELPDDESVWRRLDSYEGFDPADPARSLFVRVKCRATLRTGEHVDCWVYLYNGTPDAARRIATGSWRDRHSTPQRDPAAAGRYSAAQPMSTRKRPVIGVTTGTSDANPKWYETPGDYATSVERAGGLPLLIPYRTSLALIPEIVDLLDGILFTGGNDLDPSLYGDAAGFHPRAEPLDPARQRFELALMAEVERRRLPALGVCLGSQLMNVYRGGSLHQFLPDLPRDNGLEHRKLGDDGRRHPVRIEPGTILYKAVGKDQIVTNTRHKQAIKTLGRDLRASAWAPDGVVEAIEDPSMPLFLAVQWHPENLSEQPEHLAPFKVLVETARGEKPVASSQ